MFSITKFSRPLAFLYPFLIAGILLRVVGLFFFPSGMEGDEVVVVYWGRRWIQEGQWLLITSQDLPAWETPSAYFFGALDLLGINPRVGAVAISFLELGICYLWTRKRAGGEIALIATTFLSLMPWHLFFSYVLGPCVAGLWLSLYLLDIKNPFARIAVNLGGLFYYVSFRVVLFWGAVKTFLQKRWHSLGIDIASGLLGIGIIFLLGNEHIQSFFNKGSYLVTQRGPQEWAHHYLNSILLWWLPPLQVYWGSLTQYSMDDVGFAFANSLGFQTPLSIGTSLFFGWGLYLSFKQKKCRDLVGLFILTVGLVGFSPSYVHFPFILPVVSFVAALAAHQLISQNSSRRKLLIISLGISLVSCLYMTFNFARGDRWQTFTDNVDKVPSVVKEIIGKNESFIWVSGYDYRKARLAGERTSIEVVPLSAGSTLGLTTVRMKLNETGSHWVFIHNTVKKYPHPRSEKELIIQQAQQEFAQFSERFERNMNVRNSTVIEINGTEMGTLYELHR